MPTFEGSDGSFFARDAGGPVNSQVSSSGSTISLAWNERALFVNNAAAYAALTVKLPLKVESGEKIEISCKNTITALDVKDGFGVLIVGGPTTLNAGQTIEMRYVSTTVGWVAWSASQSEQHANYVTNAATSAATLVSATFLGGGSGNTVINMTGTLGAGAVLTLPTVANMVLRMPRLVAGATYMVRIINSSSANFAWTVTTNTGWSALTGTMTIAQNTFRDFIVTVTSATAATLQSVGVGTI